MQSVGPLLYLTFMRKTPTSRTSRTMRVLIHRMSTSSRMTRSRTRLHPMPEFHETLATQSTQRPQEGSALLHSQRHGRCEVRRPMDGSRRLTPQTTALDVAPSSRLIPWTSRTWPSVATRGAALSLQVN